MLDFGIASVKDMPKPQLLSLSVRGLGVVTDVTLDFEPGFTVITGETGAGKTLLVDALTLCLGGESRAPRRGDELSVIALFVDREGRERALQRVVGSAQRLRATIDGQASSSDALRALGDELITIHGQHDSLRLKNRADVLVLLDAYGAVDASALYELKRQRDEIRRQMAALGGSADERQRELDYLSFQMNDIDGASISGPDELEVLIERLTDLTLIRDQMVTIQRVAAGVLEDGGAGDAMAELFAQLPNEGSMGEARAELMGLLEAMRERLSELNASLDDDALSEDEIDLMNQRVDQLRTLARKYGGSLVRVLEMREKAQARFDELSGATELLSRIDDELDKVEDEIRRESARLRHLRSVAGERLSSEVTAQFARVALPNATLEVTCAGDDGSEVDLIFAPNPGAPGGPLQSVASGGELSRVLLALSLVVADEDVVTIFDEIDAGVGGNVAQSIGECLSDLAESRQVVSVTHLASVAAMADHHFVVEKHVVSGVTQTSIRKISGSERVAEVARMLAGGSASTESRALAERLLKR